MTASHVRDTLLHLDVDSPSYATEFADTLLRAAIQHRASDIHLQPTNEGIEIRWRIDGVLQPIGDFSRGTQTNVIARLKVMAHLLTYRTDTPQEGRIRDRFEKIEMRISTFPTLWGERAVVRIFAEPSELQRLDQLGFPQQILSQLRALLLETTGALLVTGPAGSGKTTTAYACLRELAALSNGGRSIVSLEDPIESAVPGVSQSQVNLAAGFDLISGLKSLLRQDPEVLLIGEMRDRPTAEVAMQAALTGQFVVTTFHAGNSSEAIGRLLDMGIEPYVLRSAVLAILSQRLVRRLCDCARSAQDPSEWLGLPVDQARLPTGCDRCSHTGYRGRKVLSELMLLRSSDLAKSVKPGVDTRSLHRTAQQLGMISLQDAALEAVRTGQTSPSEVRRVLGFTITAKAET